MEGSARTPRLAVVVLAGGSGVRAGGTTNKVLLPLAGVPVLAHSVRTALALPGLRRLVVVVREADRSAVAEAVSPYLGGAEAWLVSGGATRHGSETAALAALRAEIEGGELDVVALHDAARPLATTALWRAVVEQAHEHGGAVPVVDTVALVSRSTLGPVDPQVAVQTPQAFRAPALLSAYDAAALDGFTGPDTSACLEAHRGDVSVVAVRGERSNLKLTWPGDVDTAHDLIATIG